MAATTTTMKMKFFLILLICMLPGNYEGKWCIVLISNLATHHSLAVAFHNHVTISCEKNCFEILTDEPCAYLDAVIINGMQYHHNSYFQEQSYCVYYYGEAPLYYQCYNSTSNNISCNNLSSFSNSKICLNVSDYRKQFGKESTFAPCLNSSCFLDLKLSKLNY